MSKPIRIAIDIGHARNTGASGCGHREHDMCATIAAELKHKLETYKHPHIHADIIDYPDTTNSADLAATARAINAGSYAASVSLHMDAADNESAHGAHICYYSATGKKLAAEIALRLCPQMPGRAHQTIHRPDLYILKHTKPVAVLVECGFITNPGDAGWAYHNPDKIATSIALGIAAYLTSI